MARPPITDDGAHRPLRAAPQRGATRRLGRRPRDRPRGQDALLLLRPAVRHQAQGPRQRGRRLRAVVRVPVQRGQALPEGREALPAGQPPRSAAAPAGARPRRRRRVPAGQRGTRRSTGSSREIRRIQAEHGADAFAMLSGRLAHEREELPRRQVRPARAGHRQPRLQRPPLHGVGRRRQQEGARHRPGAEPVERHPARRRRVRRRLQRRRVRSRSPRATSGGPATAAPSSSSRTHASRRSPAPPTSSCRLRPGTDSALFGTILHVLIATRLARPRLHRRAHRRLRRGRRRGARHDTPAWAADDHRRARGPHRGGRRAVGHRRRPAMLLHARGIEHHTQGRRERARRASTSGSRPASSASPAAASSTITGQGNGQGGREHGHKCDQLPGNRDITNPEHRAHVASVWGCDEAEIPGKGLTAQEIIEAIHAGEIKGLLSICFNPVVSLPDIELHRARRSTSSSSTPSSTSSCPRPRTTPTSCCPARSTRRTRARRRRRGPRSSRSTPRSTHPARPAATGRSCRPRRPPRQGRVLPVHEHRGDLRRAARRVAPAAPPTTPASPGSASRTRWASSGLPRGRPPGHAAPLRGRPVLPPRRQGPLPRRAVPAVRPRSSTTSTRSGSPPAGWSASTCPAPRPGASARSSHQYPEPLCEMHPQPRRASSASPTATSSPSPPGAARSPLPAPRRRPRSGPTPCSSRTTGPASKAANQLTNRACSTRVEDPRVQGRARSASSAPAGATHRPTLATLDLRRETSVIGGPRRSTTTASSSSTRAAASAARPACRRARSAAPTAASR